MSNIANQTIHQGTEKGKLGLTSFNLHLLAMVLMLFDHLWATVVPGQQWMTWLGRIAYPIFAFLIAEGYYHTSNVNKYVKRMVCFALIAELPFNLMYTASWIFPFHQNVLWTFLLALLCLKSVDKVLEKWKKWLAIPVAALITGVFLLLGTLLMTDYGSYGVLTVLVFYWLRGNEWWKRLGQLVGLVAINWYGISGLNLPVELFGMTVEIPQQGFAVLALIPIWLYNGRQGAHNKWIQLGCYAFYPVHMLILGLLSM